MFLRKMLLLSVISAVMATAVVSFGSDGPAAASTASASNHLKVWTINAKQLDPQKDWKQVLDVMDQHNIKPDIILVQEVSDIDKADNDSLVDANQFRNAVQTRFGNTNQVYRYRHARDAANMVVWRTPRLEIKNSNTSTTSTDNELRWVSYKPVDGACNGTGSKQMAVRLWDMEQRRSVVAASVHFPPKCEGKNMRRLDAALENNWPVRQLTFIGGDLNSHPQTDTKTPETGKQPNPDCWYRTTSRTHDNTRNGSACHTQRPEADQYYDSVWLDTHDLDDGASRDPVENDICNQWTYRPAAANGGTACTDNPDDGDNNVRDGSRIDYIWVRWEYGGGGFKAISEADARDMITRATADLWSCTSLCDRPAYSDHKAVSAFVRWCEPEFSC